MPIQAQTEKRPAKKPVRLTLQKIINAIPDSGGIIKRIAERLDCSYTHVCEQIKKHPEAVDALAVERERVGDIAEETVLDMMRQRIDMGEAARTSRWYLERRHPDRGYVERKHTTIEGGDKPLHVQNETLLPIDSLDLPLAVKKQILEAMEKKDEKE
jgi:hypothetical protein